MLNYQSLEVLDAIVAHGSFQAAARQLHLTQSAISQRLKMLEEHFGARLVIRGQPPRTTGLGTSLLEHARRVRRMEEELALAVRSGERLSTVTLGVNSDSLATWFFSAIAPVVSAERLLLDLIIENEDSTFERLQRGEVLGCVSSRAQKLAGCEIEKLGTMDYRCAATPAFAKRYFPDGLTPNALLDAPAVQFDQFDLMHRNFFEKYFGWGTIEFPVHRIADSNAFLDAIVHGIAYGMALELQARALFRSGALIDLAPGKVWRQPLYWHYQRRAGARMKSLAKLMGRQARISMR